jgi:hypothetical protein
MSDLSTGGTPPQRGSWHRQGVERVEPAPGPRAARCAAHSRRPSPDRLLDVEQRRWRRQPGVGAPPTGIDDRDRTAR